MSSEMPPQLFSGAVVFAEIFYSANGLQAGRWSGWLGVFSLVRLKLQEVHDAATTRDYGRRYMRTFVSQSYLKVLGRRALLGFAFVVIATLAVA
jgi:hypothetical protein